MTRSLVYTLRQTPRTKGLYELRIQTPDKEIKTFLSKNKKTLFQEVDHVIDSENPIPTYIQNPKT